MEFSQIKQNVEKYYTSKIDSYGISPKGVDWNSVESQELRFKQLLKICNLNSHFTINDLGCGYGAMFEYMLKNNLNFQYFGYDLSQSMIDKANKLFPNYNNATFKLGETLQQADYTIASGIFNVRQNETDKKWLEYIIHTIQFMNKNSSKAFSFNVLTKYSDKEYMRDYLYYADPCYLFDYCKRNFSRNVALLHDYDLYEFTIIVRKEE